MHWKVFVYTCTNFFVFVFVFVYTYTKFIPIQIHHLLECDSVELALKELDPLNIINFASNEVPLTRQSQLCFLSALQKVHNMEKMYVSPFSWLPHSLWCCQRQKTKTKTRYLGCFILFCVVKDKEGDPQPLNILERHSILRANPFQIEVLDSIVIPGNKILVIPGNNRKM